MNQHQPNNNAASGIRDGIGTIVTSSDISTLAVTTIKNFTRRHKVITTSYLYGLTTLLLLTLLGGGTKLSFDQQRQYNSIMNTVDIQAEYTASSSYQTAYNNYYHSKGWISCDAHCHHYKKIMERKKYEWDEIKAEGNARMSDAKSVAGLWSEVGVGEVTDSFWGYFASGKSFAKRQSMWDAMFMGMRSMSRDESMVEYMLKMLMQVLLNFSMGLIMALVIFIFGLWNIIRTYQPNPLTALFFFITAASAAFALVSTYLFALFGAAAGGVYGMAKMAETNGRIEGGGGGRRNIRGGRADRSGGQGQQQSPWGDQRRPHYQ
eukprot:CAMPEP_0201878514 /NCGR_PEP_ID=MMETSP0902-20130614/9653_1 /ASSEMBLY_ACC=CAM_ASM_000551 /TAXON_ID=420261 /ORGANISM="Thalassiosira antarctica, Strain CCMP982" /LENGTH=319 /DNA_ID=CAMNT_0048406173 /DNA_START=58 /DNA_END=1017 /DNA_ORIENTATION=-